jgi:hypothetical protein
MGAAVFRPAIDQHAQQRMSCFFKQGQHAVVEETGSRL